MKRKRASWLCVGFVVALTSLGLTMGSVAGAQSSGGTVKVGVLHSLSGTMSISEVAVRDAELLAIKEINEAGGVLGKQIEPVVEDGASDWPTFAEKAEKLLTVDEVAGRVRRVDVGEPQGDAAGVRGPRRPALLPGAVRGPRGVAEHLLHRRHDEPADHPRPRLPQGAGHDEGLPRRLATTCSPARPTRSSRPTPRRTAWRSSARTTCRSATPNVATIVSKVLDAEPDSRVQHAQRRQQRGLLQGAQGQGQHARPDPDRLGVGRRGGGRRHRPRQHRGPPGGVELLPDHRHARGTRSSSRPSRPSTARTG